MAKSVQLMAVLGLCLFAAVVNCQDQPPPPLGHEICHHYTQGGTTALDMPKVFEMLMIEFGRQIQTLNPKQTEEWVRDVDEDHDRLLNHAECTKLVENILSGIRRP